MNSELLHHNLTQKQLNCGLYKNEQSKN